MPLLAIDACFAALSVALEWSDDGGAVRQAEAFELMPVGHAERIVPMIDEIAARAGIDVRDISRVAVTLGPGSFTGVRTGIAVARALALSNGASVLGASSLAVMARTAVTRRRADLPAASPPAMLVVAVDARRGEAYTQCFRGEAAAPVSDPVLLPVAEIASALPADGAVIVGSSAHMVAEHATALGKSVGAALADLQPHAAALRDMAPELSPLAKVVPLYIRPPDAKPPTGGALPRA